MLREMYPVAEVIEPNVLECELPPSISELLIAFYGWTEKEFDVDKFKLVYTRLKEKCDYARMNTNSACMYAGLLCVLYENPITKIHPMVELVEIFRNAGFRSRVSNMMALAFLEDKRDMEAMSVKAMELYNAMHESHGLITGEDDYLSVLFLASLDDSVEALIEGTEFIYHSLSKRNFSRGNALQSLSHQLLLIHWKKREVVLDEVCQWRDGFRQKHIKTNANQILLFGILSGGNLDPVLLQNIDLSLQRSKVNSSNKKLPSLYKTLLILEEVKERFREEKGTLTDEEIVFIRGSLLLLLTNYLFRERLI